MLPLNIKKYFNSSFKKLIIHEQSLLIHVRKYFFTLIQINLLMH